MTAALAFDRVVKHYRGPQEYRALRDELVWLGRGRRAARQPVKALDGVTFEIPEGKSFAIVGLNGAGKTTALKIASRISYPTDGVVRVRGRVGALIEVGTGLHPELTGRENIRLYGRILGLSKSDIARRFDEVVEFADIGAAIDQPVKQFSSGMQLRLGFSLAAHLEPDVLLVDEAIAVGDAGFQYRCIERMARLVREGRTLVFVSHDMSAVETLCERAILLKHGRVALEGSARAVVHEYLLKVQADLLEAEVQAGGRGGELEITRITLHDEQGLEIPEARANQPLTTRVHYRSSRLIRRPIFSLGLSDGRHGCFTLASMLIDGDVPEAISGEGHIDCTFKNLPLRPRLYELWGSVRGESGFGNIVDWQRLRVFQVTGEVVGRGLGAVTHSISDAPVTIPYAWRFNGVPL